MNNKAQFHVLEAISAVAIIILAIFFVGQYSQAPTTPNVVPSSQLKVLGDEVLRSLDLKDGRNGGSLLSDYMQSSVCLQFNGSTSYLNLSKIPSFFSGIYGNIAVELWIKIKPSNIPFVNDQARLISTQKNYWEIYLDDGDNDGKFKIVFKTNHSDGSSHELESKTVLSENQWHHIVCTHFETGQVWTSLDTPMTKLIYINGYDDERLSSKNITDCKKGGILTIGCKCDDSNDPPYNNYFNGLIDEVRIYNCSLTPDEVMGNYKGDITTRGLVGEWRFDETDIFNVEKNYGTKIIKYNGTTVHNSIYDANHGTFDKEDGPEWINESVKYLPNYISDALFDTVRYNIWLYNASSSRTKLFYPQQQGISVGKVVKSNRIVVFNGYPYDVVLEMWYT